MKTNLSQMQLIKISDLLFDNIESVFDKLDVKFYESSKSYIGRCPVHGGDKSSALYIYTDGHTQKGNWICTTRGCHSVFQPTLIGFIRGVLSHQRYDWQKKGDKFETFDNTLKFISDTLKIDFDNIEVNYEELEKKKFLAQTRWNIPMAKDKPLIKRQEVQKRLSHPPRYFIDRGFSKDVLAKYDVGYCNDPSKEMYQRCVVPVYDEGYNYLVACLGRSIFEKCDKCKQHHNSDVQCPKYEIPKWRNSKNFSRKDNLYNYWFAKEHIKRSKTAILVESCGNVWKLEMAGVHNAVALFGNSLSDGQEFLLEKIGTMSVIVIMDNDASGQEANRIIFNQLKNFYNVKIIKPTSQDVAEMTIDEIKNNIGSQI